MKLCQLEFYTRDREASLEFLEALVGWKKVPVTVEPITIIEVPEGSPYGISLRQSESMDAPSLLAYFETSDALEELATRCLAAGGRIVQEPTRVIGYGQTLIVEDPFGLRLGFYASPGMDLPAGK